LRAMQPARRDFDKSQLDSDILRSRLFFVRGFGARFAGSNGLADFRLFCHYFLLPELLNRGKS
ncbi:hypothetical protein, partial [Vibrio sp. 03_296]|uniref:hypothetical protein n=1 Tax=Vibrio sp. 03_296 TaxID=2024409 RepID=UPI002D7EA1C5